MVVTPLVLILSLLVDRVVGDPRSGLHPVALLGRFIGWWGAKRDGSPSCQLIYGSLMWLVTVFLFSLPFLSADIILPWYLYLVIAPFLLNFLFARNSLISHVQDVEDALAKNNERGRERVGMLVSRDVNSLDRRQILSAAYESASENLSDSIIAPLFYFAVFSVIGTYTGFGLTGLGLTAAAVYRAANTMDAMLGYRDDRIHVGWFAARADDLLNFIPARLTGAILILYFAFKGRSGDCIKAIRKESRKRPGINGGIPIAAMAGGVGVQFEKPGVYTIGRPERTFEEAGKEIISAISAVTMIFALLAALAIFVSEAPLLFMLF